MPIEQRAITGHLGQRLIDRAQRVRTDSLALELAAKCRAVEDDQAIIGVYSTGERFAVALILDRQDLLPAGQTMLDAVERIGGWFRTCVDVQRNGWRAA